MSRRLMTAAAQLGPIQSTDSRASVVARMLELLREAAAAGAKLVVFPELALTTFFPRWYLDEGDESGIAGDGDGIGVVAAKQVEMRLFRPGREADMNAMRMSFRNTTRPESIGSSPIKQRNSVVFPLPFFATIAVF